MKENFISSNLPGVSGTPVVCQVDSPWGSVDEIRFEIKKEALSASLAFAAIADFAHTNHQALEIVKPLTDGQRAAIRLHSRNFSCKGDPFQSIQSMWDLQNRSVREEDGRPKEFFKILEDGSTVDYAVINKDGSTRLLRSGLSSSEFQAAAFVAIQNAGRAKRPQATGTGRAPASEDPAQSVFSPMRVREEKEFANELWKTWTSPKDGRRWLLMFNPFPVLPNNPTEKSASQPFQMTFSREDLEHQRELCSAANMHDTLRFLAEVNSSPSLVGGTGFRMGLNGWNYVPGGPKAGASQAQLHGNIIQAFFPLESACFTNEGTWNDVTVSSLDPAEEGGVVILLEGDCGKERGLESLVACITRLLERIVKRGNSFTALIAPGAQLPSAAMRVFIADRSVGIPVPLFNNEWAYSEVGRIPVIDDPRLFYELTEKQKTEINQASQGGQGSLVDWVKNEKAAGHLSAPSRNLQRHIIESLKMISAPRHQAVADIRAIGEKSE